MNRIVLIVLVSCINFIVYGQQEQVIDFRKSSITWEGSDILGLNKHAGTVNFKSGSITHKEGVIIGGSFKIDMNNIALNNQVTNSKLINHLKNEDFFDVKKYPITELEILHIQYLNVTEVDIMAYLTINSIRKIIKIPSIITNIEDEFILQSRFTIDRTLWKIHYLSKTMYENLKKNIISDEISFDVVMVTNADGC